MVYSSKKRQKANTTSSASTSVNETAGTSEVNDQIDNLKTVVSLVDWSSYDRLMGRVFYEKFGKVLEQKVHEFEQTKKELKECVRRNYSDPQAMMTPKRARPAAALLEQMNKYKVMDLDSDEETIMSVDETIQVPATVPTQTVTNDKESSAPLTPMPMNQPADEVVFATPEAQFEEHGGMMTPIQIQPHNQTKAQIPMQPLTPSPMAPMSKKPKMATPTPAKPLHHSLRKMAITNSNKNVALPPICDLGKVPEPVNQPNTPAKRLLDTTIQKQQKVKKIEEKITKAQYHREEQQKDKVERTKREFEERRKRVEENKRIQEAERKEKEERQREHDARVKKFAMEQKLQAQKPPTTPKPASLKKPAAKQMKSEVPEVARKDNNIKLNHHAVKTPVQVQNKGRFSNSKGHNLAPNAKMTPRQPTSSAARSIDDSMDSEIEISAYDMTKDKIPVPATEENYNVDDLSTGDETDPDDQPRKIVPKWAKKENLEKHILALRRVITKEQIEKEFGRIRQPTMNDFFKDNGKKYAQRRLSSATWNSPMSDPTPGVSRFQNQFEAGTPYKAGY